jgi:hypothetical protein
MKAIRLKSSRRLLAALLLFLVACDRSTQLRMEDESLPSFAVIGGGYELFFVVSEVTDEKDRFGRKELPVWRFKSKQRSEHRTWPTIVYGQLADEFAQTFPKQGSPLPLVEGKTYGVHATIYSTAGDDLWFTIKQGKALEVQRPE